MEDFREQLPLDLSIRLIQVMNVSSRTQGFLSALLPTVFPVARTVPGTTGTVVLSD